MSELLRTRTAEYRAYIEEYLKGVVSAEVGNAHVEVCAAQAVCARTYAMTKINSKGYITDKSSAD